MSPVPATVVELVERYAHNADLYNRPTYNETQVRREYIDPFFEALGWDVGNRAGLAPQYQEVVHEATLRMAASGSASGGVRAPDYAFRVGPQVVYYVEAKKPSVDIHADPSPAYQLRRYAWTAKLPASVLTDFQELALYDCRYRPGPGDPASQARVLYVKYTEYADRWEELSSILGREAVLRGDFDRWADATKSKRGTQAVDEAFLGEIEGWRTLLAQNIALRNPQIASVRDLNYAVQKIIDRIIFLRICEDRGIEPYGQLRDALSGKDVYARLVALYRRADDRYNSGLFHFAADKDRGEASDTLTPALAVDDRVLKEILEDLYYPKSPYEFSVLGADILGNVYEQFLGSVIRLTPAHHAKVEQKPEVRKAGGVYYTPRYIVDYIVEHTVGALLEGSTPGTAARLRILDPACGSGSFLLGAYDYLLRWHLEWYTSHETKQARKETYQGPGREWRLTTEEKKRILLNNLYGVDIDPQAVEVTKLSLLLKVLEGETSDSLQMELFQQRALPDLGSNIKCGNSLIGPDFFQGRQTSLFDEDEWQRVNPFDWAAEFPEIMGNGGFDAVIGNPPYVRQESLGTDKEYYQKHYQVYSGTADLYAYFIERAVTLLAPGGLFSYIVANKWMRANYGAPLRAWLSRQQVEEIIDFGELPVFRSAMTYPCILRVGKPSGSSKQSETISACLVDTLEFASLDDYVHTHSFAIHRTSLGADTWSLSTTEDEAVLRKIGAMGVPLGDYLHGQIYYGLKTGLNRAFVIDKATRKAILETDPQSEELIVPFLAGRDLKRYEPPPERRWLIRIPKGWTRENSAGAKNPWQWLHTHFPGVAEHLAPFAEAGQKRYDQGEYWWELRACDYYDQFCKPKLILPDIAARGQFLTDLEGRFYSGDTTCIIPVMDTYLTGILNSTLVTFFYSHLAASYRGGYLRFKYQYLVQIPIRTIDFSEPADVARHDRMVALVERMLALHRELAAAEAGAPARVTLLQRQIAATDAEIDALVYELYGLTDEEIRIVEEGTKR